jgi:2-succinyl-6-hydroxy-2,4-cyclohexadiene-1-carboxylate synthase
MTARSNVLLVDGLRWHVTERGRGPTVLLVHGFTGRGTSWGRHATALAARFRVMTPDLPGHGRTATPADVTRASVERTADDLARILATRAAAPAMVVGYSLGARIALRLAVTRPEIVRRLVLESPSAGFASEDERLERRRLDEARALRLDEHGIRAFVDEWEREPVFAGQAERLPRAAAATLRSGRLANRPQGLATSLRGAGQGSMEPLFDRLRDVRCPTLVIAGADDPIGCRRAGAIAAGIADARLEVIDRAGHAAHLERPAAFRRLVLSFLLEEPAR